MHFSKKIVIDFLSKYRSDIFVFFTLLLCFSLFSILVPKLPDFDFFNYKWYNALSFLNGRYTTDFMATGIRTCFSPIIDLPLYFLLVKINSHPILFVILCCLDVTILFFLLYKIIQLVLRNKQKNSILIISLFSIIFVATSPSFIIMSSVDGNDVVHSIFSVLALYIFLRFILTDNPKALIVSSILGILIGIAFGLKLVAISYVFTFAILLLLFYKKFKNPFKTLILYSISFLLTYLLINGVFLFNNYIHYENPFFPYFNHIFQSPYSDLLDIKKIDFSHIRPRNVFEYFFYCFINDKNRVFGLDNNSWDFRIPISYISNIFILLFIAFSLLRTSFKNFIDKVINIDYLFTLVIFVIVPFAINTFVFGTYRYIISSILFIGFLLLIVLLIIFQSFKYKKVIISFFSILLLFLSIIYTRLGDYSWLEYSSLAEIYSSSFLKWKYSYKFEENSNLILLNPLSSCAVYPQLSKSIHVVGYSLPYPYRANLLDEDSYVKSHLVYSSYLENYLKELISSDKKIYVAYSDSFWPNLYIESLDQYNKDLVHKRKLTNCKALNMDILSSRFWGIENNVCEYNKEM